MKTPFVITVLGTWASELDRAGEFEAADSIDVYIDDLYLGKEPRGELERQVMHRLWGAAIDFLNHHDIDTNEGELSQVHELIEELSGDFIDKFESHLDSKKIDDGRFGINDADNPTSKAAMVRLANSLDKAGLYREADMLDLCLAEQKAPPTPPIPLSPPDTAYSLYRIIMHLLQRSGLKNQGSYLANMRKGLSKLNPLDISSKKANPAAAVGAAINIIKNVLVGQDPSVINSVLMELQRMI